ncbi:MAG: hypothetical protein J6V50_05345 [Clostridia bacterium]|nr:hypothetical protein [Clostridia bacterium]
MTFRKLAVLLCAVLMLFTFTSCNYFDISADSLITPPLQDGDIYPIQLALEKSVGKDITLKYPISGDFRSAFSFKDIDGDGDEEALALYSVSKEGTVSTHLNIIDNINDEWVSCSDVSVVGNGVEKMTFCDLNNDKIPEIIIGWMIYGTVDKQVGVYTYDGNVLNQRAMEKYTDFICECINTAGNDELIIINLNTTEKTSAIKILKLSKTGIAETGTAMLDGGVTSYSVPIVSKLADGRPALYLDAIKGTGTLTEIVWFDGTTLKSTYNAVTAETSTTYRPSAVYLRDINGDELLDIPMMSILPSTVNKPDVDKVYVTSWSNFDGTKLKVIENTFMNYTDGYYLSIQDNWMNRLHLARKTDSRQRIFYSYDPKEDVQGAEIFRIISISVSDVETGKFDTTGYEKLGDYADVAHFAKVIEDNELKITFEMLKDNFYIIK